MFSTFTITFTTFEIFFIHIKNILNMRYKRGEYTHFEQIWSRSKTVTFRTMEFKLLERSLRVSNGRNIVLFTHRLILPSAESSRVAYSVIRHPPRTALTLLHLFNGCVLFLWGIEKKLWFLWVFRGTIFSENYTMFPLSSEDPYSDEWEWRIRRYPGVVQNIKTNRNYVMGADCQLVWGCSLCNIVTWKQESTELYFRDAENLQMLKRKNFFQNRFSTLKLLQTLPDILEIPSSRIEKFPDSQRLNNWFSIFCLKSQFMFPVCAQLPKSFFISNRIGQKQAMDYKKRVPYQVENFHFAQKKTWFQKIIVLKRSQVHIKQL